MKPEDRRAFLKKLAKGAAYTAPVIHSMAAPLEVLGQGKSVSHKQHRGGGSNVVAPTTPGLGGQAPGAQPPPGDAPPP